MSQSSSTLLLSEGHLAICETEFELAPRAVTGYRRNHTQAVAVWHNKNVEYPFVWLLRDESIDCNSTRSTSFDAKSVPAVCANYPDPENYSVLTTSIWSRLKTCFTNLAPKVKLFHRYKTHFIDHRVH